MHTAEIYLNLESKRYYYLDFNENVLNETHDFWRINESIKPHLVRLNSLSRIQPLYSKYPERSNSFGSNDESYLAIAYTASLELPLLRTVIPYLVEKYNNVDGSKFYFTFNEPKDNANFQSDSDSKIKLGCIINPDYFRINHIRLYYQNYNKDRQIEFWNDLTECLVRIVEEIS